MVDKPSISVDVSKDLQSFSALKTLLSSPNAAIFNIGKELGQYLSQPVRTVAQAGTSAKISLTDKASWKTLNGITFSLLPSANCAVAFAVTSTSFDVAMHLDDTTTTKVSATPPTDCVYVNIDLDFDIQGSASGSGNIGSVGIAGKASGGVTTTLSFSQPVSASLPTSDALLLAFSKLVFPFDPQCASSMDPGSLVKVTFDATFNCEVSATYGLAEHKLSSSSVANALQSLQNLQKVVKVAVPAGLDLKTGVTGKVNYAHAGHFGLIVNKTGAAAAMLYLVRSAANEIGASVGVNVGITPAAPTVTIDANALGDMVNQVTGSTLVGSAVAKAASQPVNKLQTIVNGKLKTWIADVTGQVGLTASLDRQSAHTALFNFQVNLAKADLAAQSWAALVGGDIPRALAIQGLTLQPGSGVAESLKRTSVIQLQFFNLYSAKTTTDYFSNAYAEFGPDGTIRIFHDLGEEQKFESKKAFSFFRLHFVATATEDALRNISQAQVDFYLELSEKGSSKYAAAMSQTVGMIPADPAVHAAQSAMANYVAGNPAGTLTVISILRASAYRKLACSPYLGGKPPALPHVQDQNNWIAFQTATEALMPGLGFVPALNFATWMDFNRSANDRLGSTMNPDRRHPGNSAGSDAQTFLDTRLPTLGVPDAAGGQVTYFLLAGAGFMNLCEDLQALAARTAQATNIDRWNDLVKFINQIVNEDAFIDYAMPTAGALLQQCSVNGAQVTTVVDVSPDSSAMTCTLTLA